jgi:hypothetical protein
MTMPVSAGSRRTASRCSKCKRPCPAKQLHAITAGRTYCERCFDRLPPGMRRAARRVTDQPTNQPEIGDQNVP